MKVAFYLNCVSAHQVPLAKEVAALVGRENFVYVSCDEVSESAQQQGDTGGIAVKKKDEAESWLESADFVYTGIRDLALMERRATKGLKTVYYSERWFKPILVGSGKWEVGSLPGWVRMFVPGYRKMVKRFVRWANGDPNARVLAIGPWAKGDFLRMGVREEKLVKWGYFVEPSRFGTQVPAAHAELDETCVSTPRPAVGRHDCVSSSCGPRVLRVLWAGRDIPLKHVRDIEKAVKIANDRIVGGMSGSGTADLGKSVPPISFTKLTGVTPAEVRSAMREHDVFVFASNGYEGWGAVVSEALEEGMNVIGTWECGACPTLLPKERLYHCGDVKALAKLLTLEVKGWRKKVEGVAGRAPVGENADGTGLLPPCSIGEWTAKKAAKRLIARILSVLLVGCAWGASAADTVCLSVTNVVMHYVQQVDKVIAPVPTGGEGIVAVVTDVLGPGRLVVGNGWVDKYPGFVRKFGSDIGAALLKPTGKNGPLGEPMYVWQDFVAGTDPTDMESRLRASITLVNGKIAIECSPRVEDQNAPRLYRVWGKKELTDTGWAELTGKNLDGCHYFKVTVEMAEGTAGISLPEDGPLTSVSVESKLGRVLTQEDGFVSSNVAWGDYAFGETYPNKVLSGRHAIAYEVKAGDRMLITAQPSSPAYIALLTIKGVLQYGYEPGKFGSWMKGESVRRKILPGATELIVIPEDGYAHVTAGAVDAGCPNFPARLECVSDSSLLQVVRSMNLAKAEYAEEASVAMRQQTMLSGGRIVFYGDSFASQINQGLVASYFDCIAENCATGGYPVWNNVENLKWGFCTFERMALLPKDTRVLIVYCGVNDICRTLTDTARFTDPALVGSPTDAPLSISEMFEGRVTKDTMATISCRGRARTFYQAYKTMLRNAQLLFPGAQILCVTPHKYFYADGDRPHTWKEYPEVAMDGAAKVQAMRDCAEEFSVPVCDLWRTSGVSAYNFYDWVNDEKGFWGHPLPALQDREASLIIGSLLGMVDRLAVSAVVHNEKNREVAELADWFVDLRTPEGLEMSLSSAIETAVERFERKGVELRNNMYIVFRTGDRDVGYFLVDKDNPRSVYSWQEWTVNS